MGYELWVSTTNQTRARFKLVSSLLKKWGVVAKTDSPITSADGGRAVCYFTLEFDPHDTALIYIDKLTTGLCEMIFALMKTGMYSVSTASTSGGVLLFASKSQMGIPAEFSPRQLVTSGEEIRKLISPGFDEAKAMRRKADERNRKRRAQRRGKRTR